MLRQVNKFTSLNFIISLLYFQEDCLRLANHICKQQGKLLHSSWEISLGVVRVDDPLPLVHGVTGEAQGGGDAGAVVHINGW